MKSVKITDENERINGLSFAVFSHSVPSHPHAHNQMRSRAQGCQVRGLSRVATDLFLFRGLKQSLPHPAGMTEDSRQRENHEKKKKKNTNRASFE